MSIKEGLPIHLKVIEEIGDVDGVCQPIVLMASFPDGYPRQKSAEKLVDKIVEYYSKYKDDNEVSYDDREGWEFLLNLFWEGKSYEDIVFRSPLDPDFREIIIFAHEHSLPITITIPLGESYHAVGTKFREIDGRLAWEIVYGLEGQRPLLDVASRLPIKDTEHRFFTPQVLYHSESALVIWPSTSELKEI